MKKIGKLGPILTLTILLMLSCSENLSLLPENQVQPEMVIRTIDSGKTLGPGALVPLELIIPASIIGTDQAPESLTVELKDAEGRLLASRFFEEEDLTAEMLPALTLGSTIRTTGMYFLVFKLTRKNGLTQETSRQFFFTSRPISVEGISSYPPSLYPGASCLLDAVANGWDGTDPYLVWKSGEKILFSGLLSEGLSRVEWVAPQEEGVYSVRLDVFPIGPEDGEVFSFPSTLYAETKIFVTRKPAAGQSDLPGDTGFSSLYHFRGDLRDEGFGKQSESQEASVFGRPVLAKVNSTFGYRLDGASGFSIPSFLLPSESGKIKPFSLELRLLSGEGSGAAASDGEGRRVIFSSVSGGFSLRLVYGPDGEPALELASGSSKAVSRLTVPDGPVLYRDAPVTLSVSVLPEDSSTVVFWYLDGRLAAEEVLDFSAEYTPAPGVSVIGASKNSPGFSGIIDELGIFTRDRDGRSDMDSGIFTRAEKEEHGRDLLLAEGFDSVYPPAWISREDEPVIERGKLRVAPGAGVTLPLLQTGSGFLVELTLPQKTDSTVGYIELTASDPASALRIPFSSFPVDPSVSARVLRLFIVHDAGGFHFRETVPGTDLFTSGDGGGEQSEPVRLRIGNSSEASHFLIDSLTVVRQ